MVVDQKIAVAIAAGRLPGRKTEAAVIARTSPAADIARTRPLPERVIAV